jgi:hypothetical protein
VAANPNTASSKSRRLLGNVPLTDHLGMVFDNLLLVRPGNYVNVDHSDMNGLMVLAGAVQTRKGRARQTQCFTGHVIDLLQGFHDRLGYWPKLIFDRGFGNYSLVTHLHATGATFYIRLKEGRFVELDGELIAVGRLPSKDATVKLFDLQLRLVPSPMSRRCKQPWYILTNDFSSSRSKIVRIYYHRFEIEEYFKDLRYIWELKRTRLNRPNSLRVILWFALLYLVTKPTKRQLMTTHPKNQTSWLRQAYEQWQRAITGKLELTG